MEGLNLKICYRKTLSFKETPLKKWKDPKPRVNRITRVGLVILVYGAWPAVVLQWKLGAIPTLLLIMPAWAVVTKIIWGDVRKAERARKELARQGDACVHCWAAFESGDPFWIMDGQRICKASAEQLRFDTSKPDGRFGVAGPDPRH